MAETGLQTISYMPSSPVVYYVGAHGDKREIFSLECHRLDVSVECYVSTGILSLSGEWVNQTEHALECVFALPTTGTVSSVQVTLKSRPGVVITSSVVSEEEAERICEASKKAADKKGVGQVDASEFSSYVPDLFRLPFSGVAAGDRITIVCEYMQSLDFTKKGYRLRLPLSMDVNSMKAYSKWKDVCSVNCKINSLNKYTSYRCKSHKVDESQDTGARAIVIKTKEVKAFKHRTPTASEVKVDTGAGADIVPMETLAEEKKSSEDDESKEQDAGVLEHVEEEESVDQRTSERRWEALLRSTPEAVLGRDFEVVYSVTAPVIQVHAICKKDPADAGYNEMAVFVTPMSKPLGTFPRAFYFCLDRSGSMAGEPFSEASRALFRVLDRYVRGQDVFNVCVFDHRIQRFRDKFVKGSKQGTGQCKLWIQSMQPEKGGTVLDTVVREALDALEKSTLLPYLVLFTDGSVPNEHSICESVLERFESKTKMKTRIFTLGIGSYCNHYFLKMLSQLGRGRSEVCVYKEQLFTKIEEMMKQCSTPVLTDISFAVLSKRIEIYPYPIPDLYSMAPLLFSVRFKSASTSDKPKVIVRGFNPKGDKQDIAGSIQVREDLPVERIFIGQQLELLSAQSWFKSEDRHLKEKVVALSVAHSLPVFGSTSMLAYEAREDELKRRGIWLRHRDAQGVATDSEDEDEDESKGKEPTPQAAASGVVQSAHAKKNNSKTVAAVAVAGTALVVATTAATFGDIQSTLDNLPLFSDLLDFAIDTTCLEDLDCDCDCDQVQDGCEDFQDALDCCPGSCDNPFDCVIL